MPLLRLAALLMLFCLTALATGSASAHGQHSDPQSTTMSPMATVTAHATGHESSMVAVADQDDADCDGDGCADGHCKHGCSCGCGMSSCAGSCSALVGEPLAFFLSGAKQSIATLTAQPHAATRGTCPLRPPIV